MLVLLMSSLTAAGSCLKKPIEVVTPNFCDLSEDRRFSQAEIDWRAANAAWNLRKDIAENKLRDELCEG